MVVTVIKIKIFTKVLLAGSAKGWTDYTPRLRNEPASRVKFDRGAREMAVTLTLQDNDVFDRYRSRKFYVYLAEPNFGKTNSLSHSMRIRILDDGKFTSLPFQ